MVVHQQRKFTAPPLLTVHCRRSALDLKLLGRKTRVLKQGLDQIGRLLQAYVLGRDAGLAAELLNKCLGFVRVRFQIRFQFVAH